nr:copper-transporting ATPase [Bifidobacterium catenulatum]
MGFDLFITVAAIVAAAVATWAILRLFLSENDDIAPSHQRITDEKPAKNHTENHTENPDEAAGATHRSDIAKRLAIATILTAPTFTVTMLTFGGITLPHWLTNPWLHAISATPVMFYCAAPMHNRGTAALKSRTPNADSLLSLAMTVVYVYSLLACVVSWIIPAGSRNQYFAFASMVAVLSLAISLIEQRPMARKASEGDILTAQSQEKQEIQEKQETQQSMDTLIQASITYEIRTRVTQITATVTMVIAVWTFALWLIFGLQPKLAIAVLIGATVLAVAGLVLQAYDRQPSR